MYKTTPTPRLTSQQILAALIGFDTTSRNSNLELIAWVEDYLSQYGVVFERVYDPTGSKANLWASIGPADQAGYILSGHTDVVPVDGQEWTSDPFRLTERDGKLYGRGTCDMKGFLAACLAQVPLMVEAPLQMPIHLALSYDEEVGCVGVRGLLSMVKEKPVQPLGCFVGEPSSMKVVIGHKGKRSVRAIVHGKGGHSSLAPHCVNAAEYAALLVAEICRIKEEYATKGAQDALYDVPHTTVHVGLLQGGIALNVVPDRCEILFEARCIGADSPDAIVERIIRYAREVLEPRMKAIAPHTGFDFDIYAGFPGLETDAEDDIVALAKALAKRNNHSKVAYGTEAGLFVANAGIASVIVGPGSIEQAHAADEFIEISQLQQCDEFVRRLIDHCSGVAEK